MDALNWSKVTLKTFRLLCIIVFTKLAELFSTLIIIFSKKIDLLEWFLKDYVTHKIITTINVYLFKGLDKDVSYTDVKLMHTVLLNKSTFVICQLFYQSWLQSFFSVVLMSLSFLLFSSYHSLIIDEFLLFCLSSSTNLYICLSMFILCSLSLHLMCQTHSHICSKFTNTHRQNHPELPAL